MTPSPAKCSITPPARIDDRDDRRPVGVEHRRGPRSAGARSLNVVKPARSANSDADHALLAAERARGRPSRWRIRSRDDGRQVRAERRIEPADLVARSATRSASSSSVAPSRRSSVEDGVRRRRRSASAAATAAMAPACQRSTRASVASRYSPPNAPVSEPLPAVLARARRARWPRTPPASAGATPTS